MSKANINIYGDIVSEYPIDETSGNMLYEGYVTLGGLDWQFQEAEEADVIKIRINSAGGDIDTAIAIASRINELPGEKSVIIEGLAASAASFLSSKINGKVYIYDGSMMMIHEPNVNTGDIDLSIDDTHNIADMMNKTFDVLAEAYSKKMNMSEEEVKELMSAETWFDSEGAVFAGLADEVIYDKDNIILEIEETGVLISNGIRVNALAYKNLPVDYIAVAKKNKERKKKMRTKNISSRKNGRKISSLDQRKANRINRIKSQATRKAGSKIRATNKLDEITNNNIAAERFLGQRKKGYKTSGINNIKPQPRKALSGEQRQAADIAKHFSNKKGV